MFSSIAFQYKIWVKPSGEQSFLYGNHVLKSGLGRITENTPQYQGVIVYSMNDLPLVSTFWLFLETVLHCILFVNGAIAVMLWFVCWT